MDTIPQLVSRGLIVKATVDAASRVAEAMAQSLGPDLAFERLTPNLDWYAVTGPAVEGLTPGSAFELAHRLLVITDVLAIEPMFEATLPVHVEPDEERWEDPAPLKSSKSKPDPDTNGKFRWHLEKVHAIAARDKFQVDGSGVRIAHLDTGYTLHPELVIGGAIRADLGYNFKERRVSPIEPLSTIDNGHGTATASVLVGMEGKQHSFPNDQSFVEGVATGAELVPMRVDNNVWWIFSADNDAKAIDLAVERNCHVISMSRSGTDQGPLRDAIGRALGHGLIVVAAAGNCNLGCKIRSPANYEKVICAGGSTHAMTPWDESSHGREVTICAPARSVYRARTFERDKSYAYVVERSSGTSYATPIVAGAAALWLQSHGGTDAIADKIGGRARVPLAFKHLLMTAGFQGGSNWDATKYGPGILDCVKLLSAPLPNSTDMPEIEREERMRSSTSERLEIRTLLKRAKAHDTDGRAVRLLMLELETAEYQPAMAPLLEGPGAKLSTLDGMKLEAQIEMLDISPQLRAVLSPMV